MTARVIALDLDGTLTRAKTLLPPRLKAITRQEAELQLSLSLGRHHVAIHPFIRRWRWKHLLFAATAPICMIIKLKLSRMPILCPWIRRLQLIDLLDEHQIHGLILYLMTLCFTNATGHVVRTSRWAQTACRRSNVRPLQVSSLAQAARDVNAVWKFALTDEDIQATAVRSAC